MPQSEYYTVGWICALPLETAAAIALLDENHGKPSGLPTNDNNDYLLGSIDAHGVVIAGLPAGDYGTNSAATVATQMLSTFPSIKIGLMVGIGGGVPSEDVDIRLGDVVISKPGGGFGGVVQYDKGKMIAGKFEFTGSLNKPPQVLLTALHSLEAVHRNCGNRIVEFLQSMAVQPKRNSCCPGAGKDQLFEADYIHPRDKKTCESCDSTRLERRAPRNSDGPQVHFGLIASGNQVMKDGIVRDRLAKDLGIICFEMEAAGLMDNFPCLVIRGICDYADSHKNKTWQGYAAATAAACAKEVLCSLAKRGVAETRPVSKELRSYSIGAQEQSSYPLFYVPYSRNPHFIGRGDVIEKIETALNKQQRVAIAGVSGVGKSQIAVEYCYRFKERYPDRNIFWVSAGTRERATQAYIALAEQLKLPRTDNEAHKLRQVYEKLKDETNGRWLMVLDDAELETFFDDDPALSFGQFIPESMACSVLITAGDKIVGRRLIKSEPIDVLCPTTEDSERLLREELALGDKGEWFAVRELVDSFGNLPMAITQVAAFINDHGHMSLTKYVQLFKNSRADQKTLLDENPVIASLGLCINRLFKRAPQAADLLCFMAVLERQEIPWQLLMNEYKVEAWLRICIARLESASLITLESGDKACTMHQLVQFAARGWLETQGKKGYYHEKVVERLVEDFPDAEYENRLECARMIPHAKAAIDYQRIRSPTYAKLLYKAARYQRQQEQLMDANRYAQEAYDLHRDLPGEHSQETLRDLSLLAKVKLDCGNYRQAQGMQVRVLKETEKLFGKKSREALSSMNDLGLVLQRDGNYSQAESMYRRALARGQEFLSKDHEDTLASLEGLGVVLAKRGCVERGRYKEAENIHRQVLEARRRVFGDAHPLTLVSMDNLAGVLSDRGKLDEAKTMFQETLGKYLETLGTDHSDTVSCVNNLACVLLHLEKYDEAEVGFMQAVTGYKIIFGEEHPYTLTAMQNMALTMVNQDRHSEAEGVCRAALAVTEKHRGNESPEALAWLQHLGMTLDRQGKHAGAEGVYRRALRGWNMYRKDRNENVDICLTCLAKVLGSQGKVKEQKVVEAQLARRRRAFSKIIDALSWWTAVSLSRLVTK